MRLEYGREVRSIVISPVRPSAASGSWNDHCVMVVCFSAAQESGGASMGIVRKADPCGVQSKLPCRRAITRMMLLLIFRIENFSS